MVFGICTAHEAISTMFVLPKSCIKVYHYNNRHLTLVTRTASKEQNTSVQYHGCKPFLELPASPRLRVCSSPIFKGESKVLYMIVCSPRCNLCKVFFSLIFPIFKGWDSNTDVSFLNYFVHVYKVKTTLV